MKYKCKKSVWGFIKDYEYEQYLEHSTMVLICCDDAIFRFDKENGFGPFYFCDYFYTKQEDRKFKLKIIENCG